MLLCVDFRWRQLQKAMTAGDMELERAGCEMSHRTTGCFSTVPTKDSVRGKSHR